MLLQDRYEEKDYCDAMQPKEYVPWLYEQMAQAVVKAWESRAAGAVAWPGKFLKVLWLRQLRV